MASPTNPVQPRDSSLEAPSAEIPCLSWTARADGVIDSVCGTVFRESPAQPGDWIGHPQSELFPGPEFDEICRLARTDVTADMIVSRNGRRFRVQVAYHPKPEPGGFSGGAWEIGGGPERNYVALMQGSKAVLLNAFPNQYFHLEPDGTILEHHVSPGASGPRPDGSPIGKQVSEVLPKFAAEPISNCLAQSMQTGGLAVGEYAEGGGRTPHGRSLEVRLGPTPFGTYFAFIRDITQQRQAEDDLRDSQFQYRELMENANDVVYVHDLKGKLLSLNRAAERLTGYSRNESLGMRIFEVVAPEQRELAVNMIDRKLGGGGPTTYEIEIVSKDGRRVLLEVSSRLLFRDGKPFAVQGIGRDITERRQMEERLRESQKLEAIGVLAGGVAHDFNNLLTGILGYTTLLKAEAVPPERFGEAVDVIQRAAERAAQLTSQLLGFARRGKQQTVAVDLHETLNEVVGLLDRTIDKRITIRKHFEAADHFILGDPGQMQQVFLNLALNARDAMPEGGELRFFTRSCESAHAGAEFEHLLPPGPLVQVSVSDTGAGMSKEVQERIFEPFFTTKEPSKGTGMGLAMVYGIVRNHSGTIRVESECGKGSTFHLSFPMHRPDPLADRIASVEHPATGRGRILVIDDEEVVRQVAATMLRRLGYDPVVVPGPREGVEYFRQNHEKVDLVLIDLIMPGMGGRECFVEMQRIQPQVKALLTSGYGQSHAVQGVLDVGMIGFVEKPYRMGDLAKALSGALEPH